MRALISVFDKSGLVELGQGLVDLGYEIISTGGTARHLRAAHIMVKDIAELTGFPEMLDGRVKTLHPKIHGGLLARRDWAEHLRVATEHHIEMIDLVVINLYPFEHTVAKPAVTREEVIENIDIGGPAMVRSAAKNHQAVGVVTAVADYADILAELRQNKGRLSQATKEKLAAKAFRLTAFYDLAIATYLTPPNLRYGENPHQKAVYLGPAYRQLQGKELSFNNIIDLEAAMEIVSDFDEPAIAIVKHTNPCGAATSAKLSTAYDLALAGDPVSAFGSIIGCNRTVDKDLANRLTDLFVEGLVAPQFDEDARAILGAKKNLRLITGTTASNPWDYKRTAQGFLAQERDKIQNSELSRGKTVTKKPVSRLKDLEFAWKIARHVKSNAIVLAKDGATIGIGAGQMSRVDAYQIAVAKARQQAPNLLKGAVMASDAFFPFRDVVDLAAQAGISEVVQPGGSKRDQESIDACNEHGLAMLFTGKRHFKH